MRRSGPSGGPNAVDHLFSLVAAKTLQNSFHLSSTQDLWDHPKASVDYAFAFLGDAVDPTPPSPTISPWVSE